MSPTTDATMGMFSPGIFSSNLDIATLEAAVPEPGSILLLGPGLLGLLGTLVRADNLAQLDRPVSSSAELTSMEGQGLKTPP
jgi:hypothetical protein